MGCSSSSSRASDSMCDGCSGMEYCAKVKSCSGSGSNCDCSTSFECYIEDWKLLAVWLGFAAAIIALLFGRTAFVRRQFLPPPPSKPYPCWSLTAATTMTVAATVFVVGIILEVHNTHAEGAWPWVMAFCVVLLLCLSTGCCCCSSCCCDCCSGCQHDPNGPMVCDDIRIPGCFQAIVRGYAPEIVAAEMSVEAVRPDGFVLQATEDAENVAEQQTGDR
eukprot:TRINITY_DN20990_c0_g1_i3.p1 TRINITY_DN20990_c0_g1~~TRINITY_DN20990_c0_g1_i3.p1  ORF type:complete len:219 (+),score=14.55 TRINITY_DN20990_c0_g1_i3:79-735(+)